MISVQDAVTQFKAIVGAAASWAILAKSQFVEHLALFCSWALRDALWKIERAKQEFFLSTALNDSSIRAHAESREYVPRKATPSRGPVRITNNGANSLALPDNVAFISDAQVEYLLESAAAILAGGYVDVQMAQLSFQAPLTVTVEAEIPFFEVLFPLEMSGKLAKFQVSVDTGDGFETWNYARLFQNCLPDAKVYDEFFSHRGQAGIRFGNSIFGQIPELGAVVKVEYWTTEGQTALVAGQQLQMVSDILDLAGQGADVTITTLEAIDGGGAAEDITEMRKNLHYWPRYNKKLVWDDDYAFYIKSRVAGITWVKCWGEQEQEAEGGFNVSNINRIFFSAHAPLNPTVQTDIYAALADVPLLNRKFLWVAPMYATFTLEITGSIARDVAIATATAGIQEVLEKNYGVGSTTRRDVVRVSDIYDLLKKTGYFDGPGAYYQIVMNGTTVPSQLRELVSIDIESSVFTLTYP